MQDGDPHFLTSEASKMFNNIRNKLNNYCIKDTAYSIWNDENLIDYEIKNKNNN